MNAVTFHPLLVFGFSLIVLWLAAQIGVSFHRSPRSVDEGDHEDFAIILTATLTLLGLIVGFTFSMAVNRYEQRKNYEEGEANAIGTEWVRADMLPADDAAKVRSQLRNYLDQRILFYVTPDEAKLEEINARTARLQADLWSSVQAPATAHPTPVVALAVAGMNDVLNAQGYTQAAFWNRIPLAAWGLMVGIAICCNVLFGFGSHSKKRGAKRLLILPLIVSIAFMLIADIDTPRHGLIEVKPQNLLGLAESLRGH